jgi:hypothetical protein
MPLTKFLEGTVFDPEMVKLTGTAFDDACRRLELVDRTDLLRGLHPSGLRGTAARSCIENG